MPDRVAEAGRSTLVFSLLAQSAAMLPVFLTGSLYPLIANDIVLPPNRLGMIVATFFAFSALASASVAMLVDRVGPWTVTRICLIMLPLALALLAGASTEVYFYFGMAIAGIANGCIQPATNVAISRHVVKSRQGIAFGLKQSAIPFAALVSGFAVPVVGLTLGWRAAYGAVIVLLAVLLFAVPRPTASPNPKIPSVASRSSWTFIALVSGLAGLGAGSANAMAAFIVGYGVSLGISPATAGFVVAAGSAFSIGIRLILGMAADRYAMPIFFVVALLFVGGAVGYEILALYPTKILYVVATILAFGMGWGWAGISLLGVVRASGPNTGRVTAMMQAGLFCGAVLGPLGFGWIVTAYSYSIAWMTLGFATLIGAGLGLWLHQQSKSVARA